MTTAVTLRAAYAGIDRIDPAAPSYKALVALLDKTDDKTLVLLASAEIKFVSMLARNRCSTRGLTQ
jgi:hypothetical protein